MEFYALSVFGMGPCIWSAKAKHAGGWSEVSGAHPADVEGRASEVSGALADEHYALYRGVFFAGSGLRYLSRWSEKKYLPICVISPAFLPQNPT